jgi:hypothetical protein
MTHENSGAVFSKRKLFCRLRQYRGAFAGGKSLQALVRSGTIPSKKALRMKTFSINQPRIREPELRRVQFLGLRTGNKSGRFSVNIGPEGPKIILALS